MRFATPQFDGHTGQNRRKWPVSWSIEDGELHHPFPWEALPCRELLTDPFGPPNLSALRAFCFRGLFFPILRRRIGLERTEKSSRDGGDFLNCDQERRFVCLRRLVKTADFSHELERSRVNLFVGDWWIKVKEWFDVSAHRSSIRRVSRQVHNHSWGENRPVSSEEYQVPCRLAGPAVECAFSVVAMANRQTSMLSRGFCKMTSRSEGNPRDLVERIRAYLSMFCNASFRATSGVDPPFVAISKAAFIELQNLPICGMFGITTPFSAFS